MFEYGYAERDVTRVHALLRDLIPHLRPKKFILVGGIATRYNVARAGLSFPIRPLNDVDIIIEDIDVILPTVTQDFLVYHRHPKPDYNGLFYVALIYPKAKLKVDFFDYSNEPEKVYQVNFGDSVVHIQSSEDQLVNTAQQAQRISLKDKVDPKQISDLLLLAKASNIKCAEQIWMRKHFQKYNITLSEAIQRGVKIAEKHPEWLQVKPRRKHQPYECPDCVSAKEFPVTAMEVIYEIMGYKENCL